MAKIIYLPARQAHRIATTATFASVGLNPVQLHAQAHNALVMAVHYLNQPQFNVPGATPPGHGQLPVKTQTALDRAFCRRARRGRAIQAAAVKIQATASS